MMTFLSLFLAFLLSSRPDIPPINQKIIEYIDAVMGQQVDTGECWDLAAAALKFAGARHDFSSEETLYVFGQPYDPASEPILPGDIIQFEGVQVEWEDEKNIVFETFSHHTAVVYTVEKNGTLRLAHQNTAETGRKVGVTKFDPETVRRGKMLFYRPVPS
jgi:hypothetical protein